MIHVLPNVLCTSHLRLSVFPSRDLVTFSKQQTKGEERRPELASNLSDFFLINPNDPSIHRDVLRRADGGAQRLQPLQAAGHHANPANVR